MRPAPPIRKKRPSKRGMRFRVMRPAPVPGRWTSSYRASGSKSSRTTLTAGSARRPKVDRLVMMPMPEPNARTAALLSGQVDWIENPAPDALPQIKQRGFVIYQNEQPHVWPWQFSRIEGSPWNDIRVRKAANLCIDRSAMKDGLLSGLMVPASGTFEAGHPWRGNPKFEIKYDPNEARKLMAAAGFSRTSG